MYRNLFIACLLTGPAAFGLAACAPPAEEAVPTLRFSAIPDDNTTELLRKYGPVAEYLSDALGVPVEYVPAADYGASVEMFKNGDVQLAWFGGLTGVQARQAVEGAHAIAQGAEDPEYFSYFIANTESGLEPSDEFPEAIADARFTFGSTKSTSGRLMPEYFIRDATGRTAKEFFRHEFGFSGSHDQTIEQVAGGAFDAGAVSYRTFDAKVAEGLVDTTRVRVIWKTPHYADYNFTAHPDLETAYGEGFTARLQRALLEMKDPGLLGAFRRSALIAAEDREFDGILEVARSLGMAR